LKSGNFGSIDRTGAVKGFDGKGADQTYNGANTAKIAMAAIAGAIAKRDLRAISTFTGNQDLAGVLLPKDL
jgi:hypothetical protein